MALLRRGLIGEPVRILQEHLGVPAEQIAFALTESLEVLYDEMKSTLGEEKTMRALDLGVLCAHETIYATAAE